MDEQEGGPTFMITTAITVWEVYVVEGGKAKERPKLRIRLRDIRGRHQMTGKRTVKWK